MSAKLELEIFIFMWIKNIEKKFKFILIILKVNDQFPVTPVKC